MHALLIGYDLNKPGQQYTTLIDFLKKTGTWWHHLDSTWIVKTTLSASEMRNQLKAYVDASDEVLVVDITGDAWASLGLTTQANDWLREHV